MRTEDGSIIQECLNGKSGAFGVLVDKYKEGIYAYVYTELHSFQDAQDVTQEVFLQAYRDLRNLRRWESFAFWLYRIAHRRCIQWFRDRSRRVDGEFIEDQSPEAMDAPSLDSYRENQVDESVREALNLLPEAHRKVLVLRYFGGMNSNEIARVLGTSPAAIRKRLSRARAQLREEMVATMDTGFEGHRLPMGFTLRVVESIKRIKINPMPRIGGLPWGISLAMGFIITILSLNPHMSIPSDMAIPTGSPHLVESKVLKTGDIPVDVLEVSQIPLLTSMQGNDNDGEPQFQSPNSKLMLAPSANGDVWTEKADMPTARACFSTCVMNGKIYAIGGGVVGNNATSVVEEYDPSTDTWTKKANMPSTRGFTGACAMNGKIYVIGGQDPNRVFSNVEVYDPEADTWTRKADLPTKRGKLATCAVNGKIYAIGGTNNRNFFLSVVEEYDPSTDTWTTKTDMPTARAWFGYAVVNDKIYIIGGTLPPAYTQPGIATVEEYDPATDTWTKKSDMPTPRYAFATSALGGKIYVLGGDDVQGNGKLVSTIEEYDPAKDKWMQGSDIPTKRWQHSSSVVDGKIYIIGGWGEEAVLSSVEEYIPGSVSSANSKAKGKLPTTWGDVKSD